MSCSGDGSRTSWDAATGRHGTTHQVGATRGWIPPTVVAVLLGICVAACSDSTGSDVDAGTGSGDSALVGDAAPADAATAQIVQDHLIGPAAAFPIAIDLLTEDDRQYVAYFDGDREMTVAARWLGESAWSQRRLGTFLPWDVHNAPHMGVDVHGHLHVAGNMHASALRYYRTTTVSDISTLTGPLAMVGAEEEHVTYPKFFEGPGGRLLFKYRSGFSGDGVQYINAYDPEQQTWSRLVSDPIIDGGTGSAYDCGPVNHGGFYHLAWVWRETPATSTNHDVCYARSMDLIDWERSDGSAYALPIVQATAEVIDPVPTESGLLNTALDVGFDTQDRPIVSYVRYDADGNSQVYNTRLEGGAWVPHQTSDWLHRLEIGFDPDPAAYILITPVQVEWDGGLSQSFLHWIEGRVKWRLDEQTLLPIGTYPHPKLMIPEDFLDVRSPGEGLRAAMKFGRGTHALAPWFFLRWEVAAVIDPQPAVWPDPTELRVYLLQPP